MNTKYPINGRYTSLGDLVQEYGKYSAWPTCIQTIISNNDDDDELLNDEQSQETEDDEITLAKKFYWNSKNQPFVDLVFGDSDNAIVPYELVWFDDIYSKTKKDLNSKRYKLIQEIDSCIFSFGREVRAREIQAYDKNKEVGIPFRFVVADRYGSKPDRYYFNYKTSSGEAVVMYALRNIIETCNNNNLDASILLFGSQKQGLKIYDDNFQNEIGNLNVLNPVQVQVIQSNVAYIIKDESYLEKNGQKYYFIFPSLFTYDTLKLYDQYKEPSLYQYDYDDTGIFEDIETLELSPKAYTLLGNFVWSKKHIQYINYTSDKKPILNTPFELYGKDSYEITLHLKFNNSTATPTVNHELKINDSLLEQAIIYFVSSFDLDNFLDQDGKIISPTLKDKTDYSYKYIHTNNVAYKLLYFCKLFLNSQRYYYSYVTAMRFIRISTLSYAGEQPILRCDLGIYQIVESITIINAVHDYMTALPPGPLSLDTTIKIDVTAKIKYEGMQFPNEETFPLILTFNTIKIWSENEGGNPEEQNNWVRLISPGSAINQNGIIGDRYTTGNFLELKYEDEYNILHGVTDGSLGTLIWPNNDNTLKVQDLNTLNSLKKGGKKEYVADTFDNHIISNLQDAISSNISPFGCLRIHTVYSSDTDETIENSSYYIDVSILRVKNYYYESSQQDAIENTELNMYYNPVGNNGTNIPNTPLTIIKVLNNNDIYANDINSLNSVFNQYVIPKEINGVQLRELYLRIKSLNGTYLHFASGAKKINSASGSNDEFAMDKTFTIEGYNGNAWISLTNNSSPDNNNKQYSINFNDSTFNSCSFVRIKLNITDSPIYYLKVSDYDTTNLNTFTVKPLFTIDNQSIEQNLCTDATLTDGNMNISYLLYNSDGNNNLINDALNFSEDRSYNLNNILLYFKLTSVWSNNTTSPRNYTNTGSTIYIYYKTSNNNDFQIKTGKPIFNEISLNDIQNNSQIYVAFNPIYYIGLTPASLIPQSPDNIKLTKIYYKNNSTEANKDNIENNYLIGAFNTKNIYLKADSFIINNNNLISYINSNKNTDFIAKLKINNQYTFITNDMYNDIILDNIKFKNATNNIYKITLENITNSVTPSASQKCVKIFFDNINLLNNLEVKNNDNPVTLTPDNTNQFYYILCNQNDTLKITCNFQSNGTYKFYGIYDSINTAGNNLTSPGDTKQITINNNTTIICKTELI